MMLAIKPIGKEKVLLVFFLFSFLLSMPRAEAKFFNLFEKMLGKANEADSSAASSQTLTLLAAPLNSNLAAGI